MKNFLDKIVEVSFDFTDENEVTFVDAYSADESEEGMSIGYIINNSFYPKDNEVLQRKNLMDMIEDYLNEQKKDKVIMETPPKVETLEEPYRIESSWGTLLTDKEGNVIGYEDLYESKEEENHLLNIKKIDVEEYLEYMRSRGWEDIYYDDEDILFFGFWKKDGSYEPANKDWRKEMVFTPNTNS